MGATDKRADWRIHVGVSVAALTAIVMVAAITQIWVLTAIPVGFVFGFLMQRGDLCGASTFSEVVLLKSGRKVWGYWIWIVTGMACLAILDLLGLAQLNPKPFIWVNYLVGGVVFGAGTVLAGGCVSGSLMKTGIGHLTSMVALLGIALGVAAVLHGPLHAPLAYCKEHFLIKAADGGSVTLSSLTGLPFWVLAVGFAVATIVGAVILRRRKAAPQGQHLRASPGDAAWSRMFTKRSWKPWKAGLALGVLTALALLSSAPSGRNYPLGVTKGVLHAQLLITDSNLKHVWRKPPAPAKTSENIVQPVADPGPSATTAKKATASAQTSGAKPKKISWWLIAEILSLIAGAWVAARMSGEARLFPKPPEQVVTAFFGGLLVGSGAAFAGGCFIGNVTSGWALMSIGNVLFGIVAILANWTVTYFYIMGGSLFNTDE